MAVESYGDIHALPEDCIANALSFTTPKDACRLSAVATTFRSASQSDTVWSRFLPSDFRDIISRAVDAGSGSELAKLRSKKDLYFYLCDHPILIDAGRKSFWLEKLTGKKCYMLSARDLLIVWSDTPQYWRWISLPESRFPEVAELLHVCWFEVRGKISSKMLSPCTNYAAYLVFTCNSELHGFRYRAEAFVAMGEIRKIFLDPGLAQQQNVDSEPSAEHPKKRSDGWMEVELGDYFVKEVDEGDLEFCLMQVTGDWKRGLIVQGIEIRPKEKKIKEADEEEKQEWEEARK